MASLIEIPLTLTSTVYFSQNSSDVKENNNKNSQTMDW